MKDSDREIIANEKTNGDNQKTIGLSPLNFRIM